MRRGRRIAGCLVWLAAAACGGPTSDAPAARTAAAEAPPPPPAASVPTGPELRASIHPDLPGFTFRLVGRPMEEGAETFAGSGLEIRRDGEAEPVQVIGGLEVEVPLGHPTAGMEVVDMNFDGYGDLRVIELLPPGPNVPYLNWLFDPAAERFVASPELDEITSPSFDAATRRVRSEWRDGAATYGTDVYEMVEGRPVLVGKELREYTEPGVFERTVSEMRDGEWRVVERETVRE